MVPVRRARQHAVLGGLLPVRLLLPGDLPQHAAPGQPAHHRRRLRPLQSKPVQLRQGTGLLGRLESCFKISRSETKAWNGEGVWRGLVLDLGSQAWSAT